jgi:hypothetical protein
MERLNHHNTSFNPASVFAPAPMHEDWILEQLFGIRTLEKKIAFKLANSNGKTTVALKRDMAELQARLTGFDQSLNSNGRRVRAS